jgi:hypothetical protein
MPEASTTLPPGESPSGGRRRGLSVSGTVTRIDPIACSATAGAATAARPGVAYRYKDVRPREAVRQLGHSLTLPERLGDLRRVPSALVALGQAELAAGGPRRAAEFLYRAAELARAADLLPWRIRDAERTLAKAEAAVRAAG